MTNPFVNQCVMFAMRSSYAPPERYTDPGISPLFGEFPGLPPLLFQVGSREVFPDE